MTSTRPARPQGTRSYVRTRTFGMFAFASFGAAIGCAGEDFAQPSEPFDKVTAPATYSGADFISELDVYHFCWLTDGPYSTTTNPTTHKTGSEATVEDVLNTQTGLQIEIHPSCSSLSEGIEAVGIGWSGAANGGSNSCRYDECDMHTAAASDSHKPGIKLGMNATYSAHDAQTMLQEVMHALGLPHTQVDLDTDEACFNEGDTFNVLRKGSLSSESSMNGNSGFQYGSFERDSTMSYCNTGTDPATDQDLKFWRVLYGPGDATTVDIDPLRLWHNEYTAIAGQARVFSYVNVAKHKPASASTVFNGFSADRAFDADAMPTTPSTLYSSHSGYQQWLQVDIGREAEVRFVTLWADGRWTTEPSVLRDFDIVLFADDGITEVHRESYEDTVKRIAHIDLGQAHLARFVRLQNHNDEPRYLEVAEMAVWARSDLLELRLDGDAEDQIGGTHTVVGATPTTGVSGQRDGALQFDGVDDHVRVAHEDRFAPTEGLSVMGWARADGWNDCAARRARIVSKTHSGGYSIHCDNAGPDGGIQASVYREGHGYIHLRADLPDHAVSGSLRIPLPPRFHHFALTYDGYSARLYVDGGEVDSQSFTTRAPIRYSYDNAIIVGREAGSGGAPEGGFAFSGVIDDVMVFGRALSGPEIEHFRGPLASDLAGYWDFEDHDCTAGCDATGTTSSSVTFSSAPEAAVFGTDGFISVPHQSRLKPDALTVSVWVHHDTWKSTCNSASQTQTIVSTTQAGGYSLTCNNGELVFYVNATSAYHSVRTNLPAEGKWVHVAGTYDGETMRLYLNGDYVKSNKDPSGPITYTRNNALIIGSEAGSGSNPTGRAWKGSIDELHVYNKDVGHDGVVWLYNQGGRAGFSTRISDRR